MMRTLFLIFGYVLAELFLILLKMAQNDSICVDFYYCRWCRFGKYSQNFSTSQPITYPKLFKKVPLYQQFSIKNDQKIKNLGGIRICLDANSKK